MKAIIDGKTYNTDTATLIHEWDNGHSYGDLHYCEEALYRTAKGAYFLAGSGGPGSSFAKKTGSNTWSGGERLRLVSEQEALQWLEDHDAAPETVGQYFTLQEG